MPSNGTSRHILPASFIAVRKRSTLSNGTVRSAVPWKIMHGGTSFVMCCKGDISFTRLNLSSERLFFDNSIRSTAGLKSTNAFGLELIFRSSLSSSSPSITLVHAATWPPAEPPPAAILFGLTPSRAALALTQRMADLPSATHSNGVVPCLFLTRYSAEIAIIPREAK